MAQAEIDAEADLMADLATAEAEAEAEEDRRPDDGGIEIDSNNEYKGYRNGILFFCDYYFLAHVAAGQAEDLAQVKESRGDDCRGGRHLLGGGDEHATERTRAGGDLIAGGDDVRPHPFGTAKAQEGICAFTISNTPELKNCFSPDDCLENSVRTIFADLTEMEGERSAMHNEMSQKILGDAKVNNILRPEESRGDREY
ncbi:hypothetical protein C8J57DRAFT_1229462 [Mycena rebaudengoi]|nr:hypothetical protein C8J57DRAFT_1229462 [Mycena rebaudengoi]